jgi:hypothetical protein
MPDWQLRPKEDANNSVGRLSEVKRNTSAIVTEQQFVYSLERPNLNNACAQLTAS